MSNTEVERAKDLYTIIVRGELRDDEDSVCKQVCIVRELEGITGRQFRNTAEFHRGVSAFLARKSNVRETEGGRLRRARKKAKLTIQKLADELGVVKMTIIRWEQNKQPMSKRAMEWLNKTLLDAKISTNGAKELTGEMVTSEKLPVV